MVLRGTREKTDGQGHHQEQVRQARVQEPLYPDEEKSLEQGLCGGQKGPQDQGFCRL